MLVLKLAISSLRAHAIRFGLAVAATALSVALVVSITSGFASVDRVIRSFVLSFLGTTDFEFDRPRTEASAKALLPRTLLEEVRRDPRVRAAHGRLQRDESPVRLYENNVPGIAFAMPKVTLFGISPDEDSISRLMRPRRGAWFKADAGKVVVIDTNLSAKLGLKLGDYLRFHNVARNELLELKVVGVVHMPTPVGELFLSAYVPVEVLQQYVDPGGAAGFDRVRGEFDVGVDAHQWFADWRERVKQLDAGIEIESKRESREKLDKNLRGLKLVSLWASMISVLSAAFIIFSTLSMGVSERRRQLAMLRAVGATRTQIGKLVVSEALLLAICGAAIGVPMGIGFVHALTAMFPGIFGGTVGDIGGAVAATQAKTWAGQTSGAFAEGEVVVDGLGIAFAVISCFGAALLASIWPAIVASRASPLEAMTHQAATPVRRIFPWRSLLLGLLLASLDTIACFIPLERIGAAIGWNFLVDHGRDLKIPIRFVLTIPALFIGLFIIGPAVIVVVERGIGYLLARACGVRFELLRQQLSGSAWRAAGTAASLMVGLTVLIVMNAQGRSTLQSWQIPRRFPDVFMFVKNDMGLGVDSMDAALVREIAETPGVRSDHVMPIRVTIPGLGDNLLLLGAWVNMPSRTMFIASDPRLLHEMMDLDFRDGDAATALRMQTHGRRITLRDGSVLHGTIQTPALQSLESFDGSKPDAPALAADRVEVLLLRGGTRSVAATEIAAVEPGRYILITNEMMRVNGLRVGDIVTLDAGNILLHNWVEYTVVGVVWSPGVDVIINAFDLPNRVQNQTAWTVFGTIRDVERDFGQKTTRILAANLDPKMDHKAVQAALQAKLSKRGLTVVDVREFRDNLVGLFDTVLLFMSAIAWAAMLVASLGVCNAVVAGVRTRQWQFGVLRAIGLPRTHVLRLVLMEGLLLGICGAVLGIIGGLVLAINAQHFYAELIGLDAPLILPWDMILLGSAVVMALAVLMSLWPAIAASRREPLSLLQAGRAST